MPYPAWRAGCCERKQSAIHKRQVKHTFMFGSVGDILFVHTQVSLKTNFLRTNVRSHKLSLHSAMPWLYTLAAVILSSTEAAPFKGQEENDRQDVHAAVAGSCRIRCCCNSYICAARMPNLQSTCCSSCITTCLQQLCCCQSLLGIARSTLQLLQQAVTAGYLLACSTTYV